MFRTTVETSAGDEQRNSVQREARVLSIDVYGLNQGVDL